MASVLSQTRQEFSYSDEPSAAESQTQSQEHAESADLQADSSAGPDVESNLGDDLNATVESAPIRPAFGAVIHRISATPERLAPDVIARRNQLQHPLISQTVPILTPPVARSYALIEESALHGHSGGYVCGAHGDGVSYLLQFSKAMIQRRIPGVVTFYHSFGASQSIDDRDCMAAFAQSFGVGILKGRTADLRVRILRNVALRTRSSDLRTAIFFLDNAQYMQEDDVGFLYDLRHDLRHDLKEDPLSAVFVAGIFPSDFGIMNSRLKHMQHHRSLETSVIERDLGFSSIGTYDELRKLFGTIDQATTGGSKSWTAHFLPRAFRKGYRFEGEAQVLFSLLSKHEGWAELGFPAKTLFACIRSFLTLAKEHDDSRFAPAGVNEDLWKQALDFTCFVESMDRKLVDGTRTGYLGEE
ncbi:ATP-binding protein [Caballeronia sp. LjRoot34]|uniref:hypothetical protein n=1 Tax=Caballeronia sp. LjRoot34 TaxID=3342325 RepID=UPI003ECE9767